MSGVQKCDAIIRGTEYSDYALILSSACSFYHLSFSVAVSPSASFCPTAFCCWRDTAGALERSTTMKSLWMEGTHMQTRSHTETFQPSQALSRIEEIQTTEKKEASRERKPGGSAFIPPLQPFTFHILSVVSPPSFPILPDGSQLSNFWRLHPPRSWPRSVRLNSFCKCVCVWLSAKVFDVFIRLSHDLGLNQGFRKRGSSLALVFLHSPPLHQVTNPQQGRGSSVLMPSAVSGLLSTPLSPHSWSNPFFLSRASPLILSILIILRQHWKWTSHILLL